MPRHVKDEDRDTRRPRKLPVQSEPHWRAIVQGAHVGYYKGKRGGTWLVRWRTVGGYQKAALGEADDTRDADGVHVLDYRTAQQKALDQVALWEHGEAEPEKPIAITVADVCREYVADLRARKGDRAANEVEGRLRKHMPAALGERRLADLSAGELTEWRNGLVDLDGDEDDVRRSRDTANRVLTMARAAFNLAFNSGKVTDDRAWRRVKAFHGVGEARKVILGEVQLQLLIDASWPGLRELTMAGALTGCRLGELTPVRAHDFDAAAAMLTVSGKTGSREIHLPPAAVALLRQLASGKTPDDLLFTTATGGRWTKSLHTKPFAAAVARAGLDPATTFYSLRHSYISRALVQGVPTKAVADHVGTSLMMIERYYAKFIPSDRQRYATMAAPTLRADPDQKVVAIRPGAA